MSNYPFAINTDNRVDIPAAKNKAGFAATQEPHEYINQALFKSVTNHIWGTQAQALTDDVTFYTDGSGNPLNKDNIAVPIADDDKILIAHNATATANLLLDAGGKKITIEMLQGVTLAMSTFDLTLGGAGDSVGGDIRLTQTGTLTINGNRGLKVNNARDVYEDFRTKNLIINVQNNDQVLATADNIIFVDIRGGGARVDNINDTFDMTTDRIEGTGTTNELASTWYQIWKDSLGVRKLAPDLTGLDDGGNDNKLIDSTADFVTYLVQVGDIVYNLKDLSSAMVSAIDNLTTLSLTPITPGFVIQNGDSYKIRMLSPPGLGAFKARIGAAFNNSGKHLDDSTYTQIQEEKNYLGDGTDFTLASSNWTTDKGWATVSQANDWTGLGIWFIDFGFLGDFSAGTTNLFQITMSGLIFAASISSASFCSSSASVY